MRQSGEECEQVRPRIGRAPATTHGDLSHLGLTMFLERGFDETTIDDIAAAAGIGRRTFFRYFPSKSDLPWGDFESLLEKMREHLRCLPQDTELSVAIREAVIEFNRYPEQELPFHRDRMWLLLNVPTLVAHSTLRYAAWRQVIADYVAQRLGDRPDDLRPQAIGWVCLGLSLSSYERWLAEPDSDLLALLAEAFEDLQVVFAPTD